MKILIRNVWFFILIIFLSCNAAAHTIWLKGDHHETMILNSMYCALNAKDLPTTCPRTPNNWEGEILLKLNKTIKFDRKEMEKAVRHPDDPVGELSFGNLFGLARWLWNMAVSECEGKNKNISTGLRCSTHYGDFQFMHSMSSVENTSPNVTKQKIVAWASYLLQIMENRTLSDGTEFIAQNYCSYWDNEKSKRNPIANAMIPDGTTGFPCILDNGEPWSIATMFAFKCSNTIVNCDVDLSSRNIKQKALGSLFHLIQDSYSQGHVRRGKCCEGVLEEQLSIYNCEPIRQFNVYSNQNKARHKASDKAPVAGQTCIEASEVHGPIVAGAQIFWILRNQELDFKTISQITSYVDSNIFGLSDDATTSSKGSGF
jgi:hypothetical protein